MKPRHATLIASLLAIALAACKPAADKAADAQTSPPADDAATVETAPATPAADPMLEGSDATAVVRHEQPDPDGFDRKAFSGTFTGTVPCADCPGIDTRLRINADGTFVLSEDYQERDADFETTGTWTVDADARRLQFDPDTKDDADRWFEIVSNNEIRMLDAEGKPIDSELGYSLRRN